MARGINWTLSFPPFLVIDIVCENSKCCEVMVNKSYARVTKRVTFLPKRPGQESIGLFELFASSMTILISTTNPRPGKVVTALRV